MKHKRRFQLLGQLVASKHPDIAASLLKQLPPLENRNALLPNYFARFCQIISLQPQEYQTLGKWNRRKVEIRRLFAATMLHLYSPQSFDLPRESITFTYGFTTAFSNVMQIRRPEGLKLFREVVANERVYEDFRNQVQDILIQINANPQLQ